MFITTDVYLFFYLVLKAEPNVSVPYLSLPLSPSPPHMPSKQKSKPLLPSSGASEFFQIKPLVQQTMTRILKGFCLLNG